MQEVSIQIEGLTELQCTIADFLWSVETDAEMEAIIEAFGDEQVQLIKDMMVAACLEQIQTAFPTEPTEVVVH